MNAEKHADLITTAYHLEKAVYGHLFVHGARREIPYRILQIDGDSQKIIYKNRRFFKKTIDGFAFGREGVLLRVSEEELCRRIENALQYEIARCVLPPDRLTQIFALHKPFAPQEEKLVQDHLRRLQTIDFSARFTPSEIEYYGRMFDKLSRIPPDYDSLLTMIPHFCLDFSPERRPNVETLFRCFAKEFYSEKY